MTDEAQRAPRRTRSHGYDGRQFQFRVWWVRDYGAIRPGNLFSYITAAQGVEPHGRDEGMALRQEGGV